MPSLPRTPSGVFAGLSLAPVQPCAYLLSSPSTSPTCAAWALNPAALPTSLVTNCCQLEPVELGLEGEWSHWWLPDMDKWYLSSLPLWVGPDDSLPGLSCRWGEHSKMMAFPQTGTKWNV